MTSYESTPGSDATSTSSVAVDTAAITRTMSLYAHAIDDGDIDLWVSCFTQDGQYTVVVDGDVSRALRGHQDLRDYATARAAGPAARQRHLIWAPLVDTDGDRAQARSKFALLGPGETGPAVLVYGRYDDELVRGNGAWLLVSRRATVESGS